MPLADRGRGRVGARILAIVAFGAPLVAACAGMRAAPEGPEARMLLPAFESALSGNAEFRFENRLYFPVTAGVRTGPGGADTEVPAGKTTILRVPPGSYDVYFVYANTPDHLRHDGRFKLAVREGQPMTVTLMTPLPPCVLLPRTGRNTVTVRNPDESPVEVGFRAAAGGIDLWVPARGQASVGVPDGHYDVYLVYSRDPTSLYQGDSFAAAGHVITINLVKVLDGNYRIRKIR